MIPHNRPTLGAAERTAASRVISRSWVAQGVEVEAFENEICSFLGLPNGHAVAVSSGSAALYLALWVLKGLGKRIGIPAYSCSALRNAVGLVGGDSVYLDCAPASPNLDLVSAERSELDILVAPSMFGLPIEVDRDRRYMLIEDIAQAFGALAEGAPIGLRGDVGICSFYATKIITSGGQGGAVVSRDRSLIDAVRDYRQFDRRYDQRLRFNFQMTDLQAGIGRAQLRQLPNFIEKRANIFDIYRSFGISLLDREKSTDRPVRYRAVLHTSNSKKLISMLSEKSIHAIVPIETEELLTDPTKVPVAADLTRSTVSLPIYPSITIEEAKRIAQIAEENL
ncbi:MAG: DegT/DnrJ/EryC1/StrS family aminotransferase [Methylocystis sp.]